MHIGNSKTNTLKYIFLELYHIALLPTKTVQIQLNIQQFRFIVDDRHHPFVSL